MITQNDILSQAALNESPNFISMQGIADWLYSKTNKSREIINQISDEGDTTTGFFQAGKFSVNVEDLRTILTDIDGDVNDTYSVLNTETNQMVNVSGDEIVDEINAMFTSNEVLAAGFEILGSGSEDASSMASAFESRVSGLCGSDALKTDSYKLVQKTLLDGNGTVKGKTGNMVKLLEISSSGSPTTANDFSEFTGATPTSLWSNAIWPAITSCLSTIGTVVATVLGGIFGVVGTACLSLGKAIINTYRVSANPNLINIFKQHPFRGSLNAIHESLTMSTIVYESGHAYGRYKSTLKSMFRDFHNSGNFVLGSICCYTIPGAYVLVSISSWTNADNFTGHFCIAPKVGDFNLLDHVVANDTYVSGQIFLEDKSYLSSVKNYLSADSTGQIDFGQDWKAVKNNVATSIMGSILEVIAFNAGMSAVFTDDLNFQTGFDFALRQVLKLQSVTSTTEGSNQIGQTFRRCVNYLYCAHYDDVYETWEMQRDDISSDPVAGSEIYSVWSGYNQADAGYSNKDILYLSRMLSPSNSSGSDSDCKPLGGGNAIDAVRDVINYLCMVMRNEGSDEYQPHIWLSNQPVGTVGIRSDKTIAAIYYANLAAAISITTLTAITIATAVAFRGAKKKAYVYRGYADNKSWTTDTADKKGIKACWKANRRAIRWEKIAGTYDAAANSTNNTVNSLNQSLDVTQDPAGLVSLGGTVYAVATGQRSITEVLDNSIEPSVSEIVKLIK